MPQQTVVADGRKNMFYKDPRDNMVTLAAAEAASYARYTNVLWHKDTGVYLKNQI